LRARPNTAAASTRELARAVAVGGVTALALAATALVLTQAQVLSAHVPVGWFEGIVHAVFTAALPEEAAKLAALAGLAAAARRREAVLAARWSGLGLGAGFAGAEALVAVLRHGGAALTLARLAGAMPLHLGLGALMAVLLARGAGARGGEPTPRAAGARAATLLLPTALHALYDLPLVGHGVCGDAAAVAVAAAVLAATVAGVAAVGRRGARQAVVTVAHAAPSPGTVAPGGGVLRSPA
jgi:RsiW-degrading membrane proteinase PrsW (M82 family)